MDSFDRLPIVDGIDPVSLFEYRYMFVSDERHPILVGILPTRLFASTIRVDNLDKLPIVDGIDPVSLFP